jgi:hypothetical protein
MRLGEILLESGILSEKQLAAALEYSHSKLIPIGQVVKLLNLAPSASLVQAYRTFRLMRAGMPPAPALNVLKAALAGGNFDELLFENLQEAQGVSEELKAALLAAQEIEKPQAPDFDTPFEDLLRAADRLFEEEHFDYAEQCFNFLLEQTRSSQGPESDALTPLLRRLASLYLCGQRYAEAEALYTEIQKIKQDTYGKHHVSAALALEDLADLYCVQKDFQRAQELYLSSSSVHEKYLPASLADFVNCLKKLLTCSKALEPVSERKKIGTLLTEAGLLNEKQLQKALKLAKQDGTPLGAVLKQECMIEEGALQSFLEVQVLIADGVLSGEAASRAYKGSVLCHIPLRKLLQDAGLLESLENENKNLRLNLITELDELIAAEQGLGMHHREVAVRAARVAGVHAELGNLLEAETFYRRALAICLKDRKAHASLLASASKSLGMVLIASGRSLQAEPLFMEALDSLQAAQQAESKDALEILQELSLLHYREKNYTLCWNFFMSALALASSIGGITVLRADFFTAFNQCSLEVGRDADMEDLYIRTIRALRKSAEFNERTMSLLNMMLGDFCRDSGKPIKARAQYEIALRLLQASAKPVDADLQDLQIRMAQLKSASRTPAAEGH